MTKQEREKFEPIVAKLQKSRKARVAAELGLKKAKQRLADAGTAENAAADVYRVACRKLIEGEPEPIIVPVSVLQKPEGGPFELGDTIHHVAFPNMAAYFADRVFPDGRSIHDPRRF